MNNADNLKYGKVIVIASIISLFIAIATLIWAGSKIDTKADQAYGFVSMNYALPDKVKYNAEKILEGKIKIEKLEESIMIFLKIQNKIESRQEEILNRLIKIDKKLENSFLYNKRE